MKNTAKGYKKKTWHEKLEGKKEGLPKIVAIPGRWAKTIGPGKMVILTPVIIDRFIKTIPKGKLATINLIREKFAREYETDTTCPLTTGIFVWISAGAAEEDKAAGIEQITPYWRVLKEGGKLNAKFPGGVRQQAQRLEMEGFKIIQAKKDGAWRVADYQTSLINI